MGARRKLNHLSARIAVSEAAAWTGRRFYGGRYRIVPNGVDAAGGRRPGPRERAPGEPLRIAFVGQAVERKGLPVLLRAFEALRRHVPAELAVVGVEPDELAPLLMDSARHHGARAASATPTSTPRCADADVLCAPSLGGESFGMVLTEAFAAGTPVVASDIAGYRDVVTDGADGLLVPRGDATRARRGAARPGARPRPRRPARRRRRPQRRALRVAARGRRGRRDLRGRPRGARARGRARARRGARRHAAGRRGDPPARAAAVARAAAARRARARRCASPAARALGAAGVAARRAARRSPSSASASARSARRCWPPARPGCWSRSR